MTQIKQYTWNEKKTVGLQQIGDLDKYIDNSLTQMDTTYSKRT